MSNIISDTIDGTYPVAGIDNNTQGFRDNFSIIKTGLATAQSEIGTLETTTDFLASDVTNANFSLNTEKYHNIGSVISGQNISFLNGLYQSATVNLSIGTDTINFALADWPDRDHVAKITVQLFGNNTAKTVTFTVEGGGTIKYNADYPRVGGVATATVDSSVNPILIDFWTYNQGTTVYAEYRGQYT